MFPAYRSLKPPPNALPRLRSHAGMTAGIEIASLGPASILSFKYRRALDWCGRDGDRIALQRSVRRVSPSRCPASTPHIRLQTDVMKKGLRSEIAGSLRNQLTRRPGTGGLIRDLRGSMSTRPTRLNSRRRLAERDARPYGEREREPRSSSGSAGSTPPERGYPHRSAVMRPPNTKRPSERRQSHKGPMSTCAFQSCRTGDSRGAR